MKRNMKLKLTALVAMLFMAIAVTFLSFSHADEEATDSTALAAENSTSAVEVGSKTNVDYIIANSKLTDPVAEGEIDPSFYYIVEIYSDTPSSLESYVSSDGFEKYVLNGYSTVINSTTGLKEEMVNKKVNYTSYKASDITNSDTDTLKKISNADFIYINQGKSKFSKDNDICEQLYNILHTYAVGDYKPIIFNSETKSGSNDDSDEVPSTLADLAKDVYSSGIYYYTFGWSNGLSVDDYLGHNGGSMYLGINGTKQENKGKWTVLETTGTDAEGSSVTIDKNVAKFLVVSPDDKDSAACSMRNQLLDGLNEFAPTGYHLIGQTTDYAVPEGAKLYDLKPDGGAVNYIVSKDASVYNKRYSTPDLLQVESCKLTDIENETVNLANYDFVIIDERFTGSTSISTALYNKLAGAMYGCVSIVYSKNLGDKTITATSNTVTDYQGYNYLELYYMVSTTENLSRYDNVMISSASQLNVLTSNDLAAAGGIAELINKSTYRGIGGKSSSSNMYTVLEIQPCYPIDVELAKSERGGKHADTYYSLPADVLNNVDKSTLPTDADGNITVEYYDWELTKAKIADAVGIDVNRINLVHMSTEELAASKEPLLGTYDLIYIGGNTSAFKASFADYISGDLDAYKAGLDKWLNIANVGGKGNNIGKLGFNLNGIAHLPIYTMYAHNGDMAIIDDGPFASGTRGSGTPAAKVKVNGTYSDSFALLNGNDISYDRLLELESYVKMHMPVIVEDDVTLAYKLVQDNGYIQNAIDPDCNVYKFLKYCNENSYVTTDGKTAGSTANDKKTVLWGVSNTSDDLTFSAAEYTKINTLIKGSNTRPKLTVTSMPTVYNFYDKNTRLSDAKLDFAFEVAGSKDYTTKFYIDDNGNSLFESGENMTGKAKVTSNSLSIDLKGYFGPVYWKLEVEDNTSHITAYITGLSYIKNSSGTKQTVRILQIMPGYSKTANGKTEAYVKGRWGNEDKPEGAQGQDTLYFCPVCQRGFELYEYNPIANTSSHIGMWYYGTGAYLQSNTNKNAGNRSDNPYIGKHEHTFGLPWYDSGLTVDGYTGIDDWSTNIADDINDMFNFDLDIMVRGDFEETANDVYDKYRNLGTWDDGQKTAKLDAILNSFAIDTADADYAIRAGLSTNYDKVEFICSRLQKEWDKYPEVSKRDYEALLDNKWGVDDEVLLTELDYDKQALDKYKAYKDAKADTDTTIPNLESKLDAAIAAGKTATGEDDLTTDNRYSVDLAVIKVNKDYPSIFSAIQNDGSGTFRYTYAYDTTLSALADAYYAYRDKKDIEIDLHNEYKELMRYSYPDNWLIGAYDMIIIGAADNFAQDDISDPVALADLKQYIDPDGNAGNILLFHGVLSPYVDGGASTLTSVLRGYFGMDKNRGLTNDNPKEGEYYVNYATSDANRYFMTNLSWKPITDTSRYSTWYEDVFKQTSAEYLPNKGPWLSPSKYLTNVAYTDAVNLSFSNPGISQYAYAVSDYTSISQYSISSNADYVSNLKAEEGGMNFGTDKASQNNKGIVTQYPFTLSDELNISPTHPQEYALELDNPNMTVWYSLAGGTNKAKQHKEGFYSNSSLYAASRNDGGDNYFIYSFGNISYCGAGHGKVTGVHIDNNDERRLYINIIVNSVKKSVNESLPTITVYDYNTDDSKVDKEMKKVDNVYEMEVDEDTKYPLYNWSVTASTGATIQRVRMYYDLDYNIKVTDEYPTTPGDTSHILFFDSYIDKLPKGTSLSADTIYYMVDTLMNYELKPEYFEPYNGDYTYIVIELTDSKGKTVYQRIKVKMLPHLFELTQNDDNIVLDISDKI